MTSVPSNFFSTSTANALTCRVIGCIFSFREMRSRGPFRENLMIFCGARIVNGFGTERMPICCPAVTVIRFRSVFFVNSQFQRRSWLRRESHLFHARVAK